MVEMHLLDVETQGADAYIGIVVASPFGTDLLAFSNDLSLRLDGNVVAGDPVETQSANGIVSRGLTRMTTPIAPCRSKSPVAGWVGHHRQRKPGHDLHHRGRQGSGVTIPQKNRFARLEPASLTVVGALDLSQDRGELVLERRPPSPSTVRWPSGCAGLWITLEAKI